MLSIVCFDLQLVNIAVLNLIKPAITDFWSTGRNATSSLVNTKLRYVKQTC